MVAVHKGAIQFDGAVTMAASEIVTADIAAAAVTPVKLGHASVAPAANAACAILATTTEILLTVSDATNTAISTTAAEPGQTISIRAVSVAGGGSYTLALVSGTLTLNSTGESALIKRTVADDAWMVVALTAAAAGGAAATVL